MMVLVRLKLTTPSKREHEIICSAHKEKNNLTVGQPILDRLASDMGMREDDEYKFQVSSL